MLFRSQCGVLVRDKIPISIQKWFKPATEDPWVSYVNDMQKNNLWTELKSNFTLPPEDNPENPVKEKLIKSFALKRMAELFRRWKKEHYSQFLHHYRYLVTQLIHMHIDLLLNSSQRCGTGS